MYPALMAVYRTIKFLILGISVQVIGFELSLLFNHAALSYDCLFPPA